MFPYDLFAYVVFFLCSLDGQNSDIEDKGEDGIKS